MLEAWAEGTKVRIETLQSDLETANARATTGDSFKNARIEEMRQLLEDRTENMGTLRKAKDTAVAAKEAADTLVGQRDQRILTLEAEVSNLEDAACATRNEHEAALKTLNGRFSELETELEGKSAVETEMATLRRDVLSPMQDKVLQLERELKKARDDQDTLRGIRDQVQRELNEKTSEAESVIKGLRKNATGDVLAVRQVVQQLLHAVPNVTVPRETVRCIENMKDSLTATEAVSGARLVVEHKAVSW